MSSYAQMLTERRANIWEQSKALLDTAAKEERDLTGEERASFETMNADLDSLRATVEGLTKADESNKAVEASLRALAETPREVGKADEKSDAPTDSDRLRAALRAAPGVGAIDFHPTAGRGDSFNEVRALSKLSAAAGNNTVPTSFYGKLWAHLILTANLINAGATVWSTTSGENIQVPITTAHSTAALVAEAGTIAQSDPTFGQRQVGAYKYGLLLKISRELLDDTGVDIEGYIAMEAGRAVGNALGADLVSGNGTNKPTGILNNTTLGVTSTVGKVGVPQFADLIALYYSVIPNYRNSPEAAWLFNDTTAGAIRALTDTQGRYLWEPSLVAGAPDLILNKPVFTDPNVPATALNAKSVVFGDLSRYLVRMVNGVRFERSVDFAFDADLITYRCLVRADGILIDQTGGVKHLVGAAS
jgi:HK97 family phage major capsid protein